jgi:hypothetical protein
LMKGKMRRVRRLRTSRAPSLLLEVETTLTRHTEFQHNSRRHHSKKAST